MNPSEKMEQVKHESSIIGSFKATRADGTVYTKPPLAIRKKINRRRAKAAKAMQRSQRVS